MQSPSTFTPEPAPARPAPAPLPADAAPTSASASSASFVLSHQVLVITPPRGWQLLNLADLWRYRDLLRSLVSRDLLSRYRQTLLGAFWIVLQPVIMAAIFTVFFGMRFGSGTGDIPYSVFVLAGMLPWQLFARVVSESGNSLFSNQNLVKKVYFPRLVLLVSPTLTAMIDLAMTFVILLALMAYHGIWPTWHVVALPLLLAMMVTTAVAAGVWATALSIKYRDVRTMLPFIVQAWFFLSPVIYPTPKEFTWTSQLIYSANPMVGVITGFRWALLGDTPPQLWPMAISAGVMLVLLVGGLYYFRRMEATVADYL